jgi:hypothetical protein
MPLYNNISGLTKLNIYSGSILLTSYVNNLILDGPIVTVDDFNNITLLISGSGGGSSVSASYALSASYASTASYFSGTVVSASYSETASYALRVDGGTF